jgi:F-type H+-transporting ATPase subunit delta
MAEKATIARPYARAAFDYARGAPNAQQSFATWSRLLGLAGAVASDPSVAPLLGNPKVASSQLVELIAGVAAQQGLEVDAPGRNFLGILAQNHRLAYLPEIADQFEQLRADVENVVDVEVVTAFPAAEPQRQALMHALEKRFNRAVRIRETIDESLIGGALIRAGDLVIDGSLKSRLERLATQMNQQ